MHNAATDIRESRNQPARTSVRFGKEPWASAQRLICHAALKPASRASAISLVMCLCLGSSAIRAQAPGFGNSQDNIVIVLDASGSMRSTMQGSRMSKMEAAKKALMAVLKDVPPTTNVGLLVFSSRNLSSDWVYPLGPVDRQRLLADIQKPQPGGGTPLGAYLKKGADALLKQRRQQQGFGTYRLLVVTDGEASDPQLVERFLPDVLSRAITVDCIGVDMSGDHALATRVHSYRRADNPEQLVTAVSDVLAEVGSGQGGIAQSEEDFAVIAPLPDEMAVAMLEALQKPVGDHPIGEPPPLDEGGGAPPVAGAEQYDPFASGPPPGTETSSGLGTFLGTLFGGFCVVAVLVIGVLVGLIWFASKSHSGRGIR